MLCYITVPIHHVTTCSSPTLFQLRPIGKLTQLCNCTHDNDENARHTETFWRAYVRHHDRFLHERRRSLHDVYILQPKGMVVPSVCTVLPRAPAMLAPYNVYLGLALFLVVVPLMQF